MFEIESYVFVLQTKVLPTFGKNNLTCWQEDAKCQSNYLGRQVLRFRTLQLLFYYYRKGRFSSKISKLFYTSWFIFCKKFWFIIAKKGHSKPWGVIINTKINNKNTYLPHFHFFIEAYATLAKGFGWFLRQFLVYQKYAVLYPFAGELT